jgi:hypothetical protein
VIEYPENSVWYIEARPWNGPKDGQAGFAQVDPVSRGSGVVVTFTKIMPAGERQPRSYILTCAHVVRDSSDYLLEDIICYPPGSGYVRTAENSRRCGTFPNAEAQPASVSQCSPCRAVQGPRPDDLRATPASDWVLLEIKNPSFYHQQAIIAYQNEDTPMDACLSLIGFPFGAGTFSERRKAETDGHGNDYPFWKDGRSVKATVAKDFRPADNAEPGMLNYEGPEESRPGMSGGGVFDGSGALVAIHRSSNDSIMKRGAIRTDSIVRFLRDTYNLEFTSGKNAQRPREAWMPSVWAIFLTSAFALPTIAVIAGLGPPHMDDGVLISTTVLLELVVFILVHTFFMATSKTLWPISSLLLSLGFAGFSWNYYANAYQNRVARVVRSPTSEESYIDRIIIGTELKSDFQGYRDFPPEELIKIFETADAIYTTDSLAKSRRILWWSWLLSWTTLSFALAHTITLRKW